MSKGIPSTIPSENRGIYGGYVATAPDQENAATLFYNNKNTVILYADADNKLHTATENCVTFADPVTGKDKTIEGMADLFLKYAELYSANIAELVIQNDRGSMTLVSNVQAALDLAIKQPV